MTARDFYKAYKTQDSLDPYYRSIKSYEVLSQEQITQLFREKKRGNTEARNKLLLHHLRFVFGITNGYGPTARNIGIDLPDLLFVANQTLTKIIDSDSYDPKKGYKFSSYAGKCVINGLNSALRELNPVMRVPHWRKPSDIEQISLYKPVYDGDDGLIEKLRDENAENPYGSLEKKELLLMLKELFEDGILNKREKLVLNLTYGFNGGEPETREKVSKRLGLSRAGVQYIKTRAIGKLRNRLLRAIR